MSKGQTQIAFLRTCSFEGSIRAGGHGVGDLAVCKPAVHTAAVAPLAGIGVPLHAAAAAVADAVAVVVVAGYGGGGGRRGGDNGCAPAAVGRGVEAHGGTIHLSQGQLSAAKPTPAWIAAAVPCENSAAPLRLISQLPAGLSRACLGKRLLVLK